MEQKSLMVSMASRYDMEVSKFADTLRATVLPKGTSNEQFAAFLMVAREYDLNPLTKEIYAFPGKGGGITPVVSVDGWVKMANAHPQFDGMEFEDHLHEGQLAAITCRVYRKDRSHPTTATEYMAECRRQTDVWKNWPSRMLRHKATIQALRLAFGFSGIVEPDEAERAIAPAKDVTPAASAAELNTLLDSPEQEGAPEPSEEVLTAEEYGLLFAMTPEELATWLEANRPGLPADKIASIEGILEEKNGTKV
jgi:phage recombination protein Bet